MALTHITLYCSFRDDANVQENATVAHVTISYESQDLVTVLVGRVFPSIEKPLLFHVGREGTKGATARTLHEYIEMTAQQAKIMTLFAGVKLSGGHYATVPIPIDSRPEYEAGKSYTVRIGNLSGRLQATIEEDIIAPFDPFFFICKRQAKRLQRSENENMKCDKETMEALSQQHSNVTNRLMREVMELNSLRDKMAQGEVNPSESNLSECIDNDLVEKSKLRAAIETKIHQALKV